MMLKKFCPLGLMYRLKYRKELKNPQKPPFEISERTIIYADAPDYGNLGDQAIAYAIHKYVEANFRDYKLVEISMNEFAKYSKYLKKNLPSSCMMILTGGGNMGNRYPIYEAARRYVISSFPNNKIIIFPQTYEYSNSFLGRLSEHRAKDIYGRHRNLTMCAREINSYEKMKQVYAKNHCVLCPDIVLSLRCDSFSDTKRENIGLCLRNDSEKILTEQDAPKIEEFARTLDCPVLKMDTCHNDEVYTEENRGNALNELWGQMASCKLIITDRLHAMIFAALTHTPCIAFDNTNGKIKGVYQWMNENRQICIADSTDRLVDCAERVMECECIETDYQSLFQPLTEAISDV